MADFVWLMLAAEDAELFEELSRINSVDTPESHKYLKDWLAAVQLAAW